MTRNTVHEKDESNAKREDIIKRQESQVSARSEDGEQAVSDVRSDVNAQSTNPAEHAGTVEKKKANGGNGREGSETTVHAEVNEGRKSWIRSHSKEDHSNRSVDATKPDEKKPKKSKLSFIKSKRPSLEAKDSRCHTDGAQASLSVVDRPRAPTPTPQSELHPRELPPPPSIASTSRNPRERQLSAPGCIEEDDQYEVVQLERKRSASVNEAEDSYETVDLRVRDSGNDPPVLTDSTYDVIGEDSSGRPASELYEVVDMEGRANASVAEEEENDTYEVVGDGGDVKGNGVSSADTYEEVVKDSAADPKSAKARLSVKNEGDEVDPKYSKVRQRVNAKVAKDNEIDPKYARVHHRVSVKQGEHENASAVPQVTSETAADSDGASVNQDQAYDEVHKDSTQDVKIQSAAASERPRLLKHASTPELVCGIVTDSDNSVPPPAPSLNHLKEVAEASRPRAFSEGRHLRERQPEDSSADLEVTQLFDYHYAKVDLTKKTRVSGGTEGRGENEDADACDDEPPPLPPIYVSLPNKEEEGKGKENVEGEAVELKRLAQRFSTVKSTIV